ncbi:MAG: 50S ribosomal protein L23 [Bacilli bacterium]|nr:50S ribosomal protein L23 [Bacilli bacterium]
MNKNYDIIYAPIITEKSAALANENKYVFKVDPKANKTEIKQAIESIFNVKVLSITTANSHPKKRRVGKYSGMTNKYKRAIVKLAKDNSINFN